MNYVPECSSWLAKEYIVLSETDLACAEILLKMWAAQHQHSLAAERAFFQRKIDQINRIARESNRIAWGDVRLAGSSPTPEEYVAYKLTLLGHRFDEMNASSYCPVPLFPKPE